MAWTLIPIALPWLRLKSLSCWEMQKAPYPYCIALAQAKKPESLGNAKGTCQTVWKVEGIMIGLNKNKILLTDKP